MVFTKAAVLKLPESKGRMYAEDPVEMARVSGSLQEIIQADTVYFKDGTGMPWKSIQPVEDGWFQDDALAGGYAYAEYDSDREQIVLLEAMTHQMVFVNGEPRIGNRYQYKEQFESWEPKCNYSFVPVKLRKGTNEFLFRCRRGILKARLHFSGSGQFLNPFDVTIADMVVNRPGILTGSMIVVNASDLPASDLKIGARLSGENEVIRPLPTLGPLEFRKLPFSWETAGKPAAGDTPLQIRLYKDMNSQLIVLDESEIQIRTVGEDDIIRNTFTSRIDGSIQYYAVNPASDSSNSPKALFFSMHGASVEAINQAGAYSPKTWGHVVAPTNRRPFGYNWEDWGRLDALEVFDLAFQEYRIDPEKVYLTGHSMGGHGTWIHGASYPDRFAALGPSAGWLSFWSYRVKDMEPVTEPILELILRSTHPSHTMELAENYSSQGVYILHGADDDNVPAEQAHQMTGKLEEFHHDFIFHEQPDVGHWWDLSDDPGADCVDWPQMFDFFSRHIRPENDQVRAISFTTASPGVSAKHYWAEIYGQNIPFGFSRIHLEQNPNTRRFTGTTENVSLLRLDTDVLSGTGPVQVYLDDTELEIDSPPPFLWLSSQSGNWKQTDVPDPGHKGPHRYGPLKDAFRNHFIMVVGTQGTDSENQWAWQKARFDAETFWYQGNGSVRILKDTAFNPEDFPTENIILYGNSETNAAWNSLLSGCPVDVRQSQIRIGRKKLKGTDLAVLFAYPRDRSNDALVAVVGGTGLTGMRLTDLRSYLYAGTAYPDLVVMDPRILNGDAEGVLGAGYFGPDWRIKTGEFIWTD